jgi:hypothetical protein
MRNRKIIGDKIMEDLGNQKIDNDWKKDPYTLRVKGGDPNDPDEKRRPTDAVGLSRSILHVLKNNEDTYVKLLSVGPIALNIAMKAFRIASTEIEQKQHSSGLVIRQSEYSAEINGKHTKGICTRIFPVPTKDLR